MTKEELVLGVAHQFWREVWQRLDPAAVDHLVSEDFVITSAGQEIHGREAFKSWLTTLQRVAVDLNFEVLECFASADCSRVVTRWRSKGRNNGLFGLPANQEPFTMHGTAILAIGDDGLIRHNWVERNAWEVYNQLTRDAHTEQGQALT